MKTEFQKKLIADTETLWGIVKIFHPDLPDEARDKFKSNFNYDWVCIDFRIKGVWQYLNRYRKL